MSYSGTSQIQFLLVYKKLCKNQYLLLTSNLNVDIIRHFKKSANNSGQNKIFRPVSKFLQRGFKENHHSAFFKISSRHKIIAAIGKNKPVLNRLARIIISSFLLIVKTNGLYRINLTQIVFKVLPD